MKIIKAPNYNYNISDTVDSIFLAGSIEMGTAEDWQEYATKELAKSGSDIQRRSSLPYPPFQTDASDQRTCG